MQNYFYQPFAGDHPIHSGFGPRAGGIHTGVDFGDMPVGTPILASADGTVIYTGYESGAGNTVTIRHEGGEQTRYHHLSIVECDAGDVVVQGQEIARSGNTGASTGPHLHFEIRASPMVPVDPEPLLQPLPGPPPLPPEVSMYPIAVIRKIETAQVYAFDGMTKRYLPGQDDITLLVDAGLAANTILERPQVYVDLIPDA